MGIWKQQPAVEALSTVLSQPALSLVQAGKEDGILYLKEEKEKNVQSLYLGNGAKTPPKNQLFK